MSKNRRGIEALVIALWGVGVVLGALAIYYGSPQSDFNPINIVSYSVMFWAFLSVGAFIAVRRPANPIGWLFMIVGFTNLLWSAAVSYAGHLRFDLGLPIPAPVAWATGLVMSDIGWSLMPSFLLLLFPDGRLETRGKRILAWVNALVIAVMLLGDAFGMEYAYPQAFPDLKNPTAIPQYVDFYSTWVDPLWTFFFVLVVANVTMLIRSFLRARGEERQRYKWFVFSAFFLMFIFMYSGIRNFLGFQAPWLMDQIIFPVIVTSLPVSVAFAIMRYRLYDIDTIINRTLVYGLLTALLTLVYLATVSLLQASIQSWTGAVSNLEIVLSTLAVATLFTPLRRFLQRIIDRQFFRNRYDAGRVMGDFTSHVRDAVDVDLLAAELKTVITDAVQPADVSLWLRRNPGGGQGQG